VAGSTMEGEEAALLTAFEQLRGITSRSLLVLAPRHPERFADVERLANAAGFRTIRRSELPIDSEPRADVVVLDTLGELAQLYQVATVVFVGGSLVDSGGHNILEPAIFGKPIVFGPHMANFAEIARSFVENEAAVQVGSADELQETLRHLLTDPKRRKRLGESARAMVEANRGAKEKSLAAIVRLLPPSASQPGVVRPFRVVH
jgi:3-deoxy-D-manno-octulosonic-acid transferase